MWVEKMYFLTKNNLSDASDDASNHLSKFQDRALGCGSCILRCNVGQFTAPFSKMRCVCVQEMFEEPVSDNTEARRTLRR